jgi:hypothetical protein
MYLFCALERRNTTGGQELTKVKARKYKEKQIKYAQSIAGYSL